MPRTLERGSGVVVLTPSGVPPEEIITTPERRVGLREMPDLTKVAPEVIYRQPRRG